MANSTPQAALNWAAAIQTRLPDNILKMYHPDGVLWGTLSPVVRHGYDAIHGYFVHFMQNQNLHCEFNDGNLRIHDNIAFYSGSYTFTWTLEDRLVKVPARFSFVYKIEGSDWLIMEHHSSLFPEEPFPVEKYIRE